MSSRTLVSGRCGLAVFGAALLATIACVASLAASAQATVVVHDYLSQITEVPVSSGAASTGKLSAVNATTIAGNDLWIAEHLGGTSTYRTDEFEASTGAFVSQLATKPTGANGIAVGEGTGERQVYVGSSTAVQVFGPSGSLLATWKGAATPAAFSGVNDVAIDSSKDPLDPDAGDVYVADYSKKVVDVFKPKATTGAEEYVGQIKETTAGTAFSEPFYVAVDEENGDVFVYDYGVQKVDVFAPEATAGKYKFLYSFTSPSGSFGGGAGTSGIGLAVDGSAEDVYVVEENSSEEAWGIDEFSLTGAYLGRITGVGTPAGSFRRVTSIAVSPSSHDVYVGDERGFGTGNDDAGIVDAFGANIPVPAVTTGAASGEKAMGSGAIEATLSGTVNPEKAGAASCQFVWGTSTSFGQTTPCSTGVPEGTTAVAVSAAVHGLEPDTTYYYRLQASNAKGTNPGEASQDEHFTTMGPGLHGGQWSGEVRAESVRLDALIDPHGKPASYYFQYGTSTGYGSETANAPIGAGEIEEPHSDYVRGLSPSTIYHYRVAVLSELSAGVFEKFYGPDRTLTTQAAVASSGLLDGREWEMVSPPNKQGQLIKPIIEGAVEAAAGGEAVTYEAGGGTEPEVAGNRGPMVTQVLSRRGRDGGWSSQDLNAPNASAGTGTVVGQGQEYKIFSEDLSLGLLEPQSNAPLSSETDERTAYLRDEAACETAPAECYVPLLTRADVTSGAKYGYESAPGKTAGLSGLPEIVGASGSAKHVVISSTLALTTTAFTGTSALYEWSDGVPAVEALQLVSVLPAAEGGKAAASATFGYKTKITRGAISSNGSRVFFSAEKHLYLRDTATGETLRLDLAQGVTQPSGGEPIFQAANASGSKVYFTDVAGLTPGDGASSESAYDLYECEVTETNGVLGCDLTDLTPEASSLPVGVFEEPEVMGRMIGAGEGKEGSYVYFVANGVLAPDATHGDCTTVVPATASETCNLYVINAGKTSFIATLSGGDNPDWDVTNQTASGLQSMTSRVSPNGQWLAFMSDRSLTGYDNHDVVSGEPDEEVYLYNAKTKTRSEKLVCASCNPTGARPVGIKGAVAGSQQNIVDDDGGGEWAGDWFAANVPGWTETSVSDGGWYQSRYLTDEGRLFFNSSDALVPQDVNDTEDVYEYEPPGLGSCTTASATFSERSVGCVDLISSGTSGEESAFLDASGMGPGATEGEDVFFLTAAQLVPEDIDDAYDVYDAHECSSTVPCGQTTGVVAPSCNSAAACKETLVAPEAGLGTPGSLTFSGSGNVMATPIPVKAKAKTAAQVKAEKLARALKACKSRAKSDRKSCEAAARRRYGVKRKVKAKKKSKARAKGSDRGIK